MLVESFRLGFYFRRVLQISATQLLIELEVVRANRGQDCIPPIRKWKCVCVCVCGGGGSRMKEGR